MPEEPNPTSGELDPVLENAKRFSGGDLAIAQLQRPDEDAWDALVVGADMQPLTFWAQSGEEFADAHVREDGAILMVVMSTPPGIEPAGLLSVPAISSGSPTMRMNAIVNQDGAVVIGNAGDDTPPKPPPPFGPDMIASLVEQAALRTKDSKGYVLGEMDAADGGKAMVLADWDKRPMLLWLEMEAGKRELMAVTGLPAGGFVCQAVDPSLQPLHSSEALAETLKGDG
jgi:hypothetical protein